MQKEYFKNSYFPDFVMMNDLYNFLLVRPYDCTVLDYISFSH